VGGRVIAHDVPAPLGVYDGGSRVVHADRARRYLTDMDNQARDAPAGVGDLHAPHRLVHILREVIDLAGIADLAAALIVKRRLGQHDLDVSAGVGLLHSHTVREQAGDDRVDLGHVLVNQVLDAARLQDALRL